MTNRILKVTARVQYCKAVKRVAVGMAWATKKLLDHVASQAGKASEEAKSVAEDFVKSKVGAVVALAVLLASSAMAQTNTVGLGTNATAAADPQKWDVTLSGGGTSDRREIDGSLSGSVSTDPFKDYRSLWVGMSQDVGWRPADAETDADADWSFDVWKGVVYLNPGVWVGAEYGDLKPAFKCGPELGLQWYTTEQTYVLGQVNLGVSTQGKPAATWFLGLGAEF